MIRAHEFRYFRITYGFYLIFIFSALLSDRATAQVFGRIVDVSLLIGILGAVLWTTGWLRAFSAALCVMSIATVLHFNSSYMRVIPGYIVWMLVALSFVPKGEGRWRSSDPRWIMPRDVELAVLVVFGFTIFFSGITKLLQPSWRTEDVILQVMSHSRFQVELLEWMGSGTRKAFALSTIVLEIVAPLLLVFRLTRFYGWLGLCFLFFGMFLIMKIYVVTTGMLLILAFLYPLCRRTRSIGGVAS